MATGTDDRTTGSFSWITQLQQYVRLTGCAEANAERERLSEAVLDSPASAEAW